MNLINKLNSNEIARKILELINEGENAEKVGENERGKAINLFKQADKLYERILKENGKLYIKKHYPEISSKLNKLANKLIEYNS